MAPAAPKNARWTRISNQDVTIQWDKVTGATSYGIQYQKGGDKNEWTRPGWTSRTTSFTARRFGVNSGYRFRIYATDKSGNSLYSNATPWFYTPPLKPKAPTVQVTAEGLLVKWSRAGSYYQQGTQVQVEGGATTTLGNGTSGAAPTSVLLSVTGLGMRVRVRGFVGAEGAQSRVFGAWSDWSAPVNALTAPNAPLLVAPNGFAPSWAATVFEWKHQPTDGTAQTAAEVRYREDGASAWITKTTTTAQTLSVASLAVGSYEYQVRTKGLGAAFGEWSPVAVFVVISRPVVAVSTPDETLSKLTAKWTWTQAEGLPQSNVIVTLLTGGDIVEQRRGTGTATSTTFEAVLKNATAYTLKVEAACSGLWAAAKSVSWTTAFTPPAVPSISAVWDDEGGYHQVTVAPGAGGTKPTVSLDVHRDIGSGWEIMAEELPSSEHVLADYSGLTYGDTTYRVTAWTAEGASASAEVTVETRSGKMWVRYDQTAVGLEYNASTSYTPDKHDSNLVYFDGDEIPTLIEGEGVSRKASVSGTLLADWLTEAGEVSAAQARTILESWILGAGVLPTLSTPDRLVITGALGAQFSAETGGLTRVQLSVEEAR